MPLEMSVRKNFQRLFGSLKNYLMKVMIGRGPNMGSDKYVTLDNSLKFDSLDKMIILSSYLKADFGR